MNLTIDIGNTNVKTALFKGDEIFKAAVYHSFDLTKLKKIAQGKEAIENVILCTVKNYPTEWKKYLQGHFNFHELSEKTLLPIKNEYLSPASLGKDRLASAVGAYSIYPGKNALVINAGTCITYDIVDSKGAYKGGAISPGLEMRFKALHTFTGRLPLIEADTNYKSMLGKTTEQSIRVGAQQGMVKEIEGMIKTYKSTYKNLQIIVSGGSMEWLEQSLQEKINLQPFVTLKGLNVILAAYSQKRKVQ